MFTTDRTPDYYHSRFEEYHQHTFHVDPSAFLSPLADRLKPGATVLDVGCGSGRDLVWLKTHGFKPVGFECSPGLAALARKHARCGVIEGDFETYDFSTISADALILIGALVHTPHADFSALLQRIIRAAPRGRILITMKKGAGQWTDRYGRTFYFWDDGSLRRRFHSIGQLTVEHFFEQLSSIADGSLWLGYVLKNRGA